MTQVHRYERHLFRGRALTRISPAPLLLLQTFT